MSAKSICPMLCSLYTSVPSGPVCQRPVHAPMACFYNSKPVSPVLAALICWPGVSYALQTSISALYAATLNISLHHPWSIWSLYNTIDLKPRQPVCSAFNAATVTLPAALCSNKKSLSHLQRVCLEVSSGSIVPATATQLRCWAFLSNEVMRQGPFYRLYPWGHSHEVRTHAKNQANWTVAKETALAVLSERM